MEGKLTDAQTALLASLRAALTGSGNAPPDAALSLPAAQQHAVTPLLYDVLVPLLTDHPAERELLQRETTGCVLRFYRLTFLARRCVRALQEAGVETVVLKGPGAAAYYPVPEYRKSGDIDLLLLGPADEERACAALERSGAQRAPEQHSAHHVVFQLESGIELELHRNLVEACDDRAAKACLADAQAEARGCVVQREVLPSVSLPVAQDGYQAFFLLIHMLQHFLHTGFGMRLLCDWTVFWNRAVDARQRAVYLALIERCGVTDFSRLVTQICTERLGLPEECAAPLLAGGEPFSERLCVDFLRDVFDAGEFGDEPAERMVVLRGRRPGNYLRELHRQMRLNFPRAGRIFLLWPALWLVTILRFLYNNRAVRKTTLRSVLRETGRRSRLAQELQIFKTAR